MNYAENVIVHCRSRVVLGEILSGRGWNSLHFFLSFFHHPKLASNVSWILLLFFHTEWGVFQSTLLFNVTSQTEDKAVMLKSRHSPRFYLLHGLDRNDVDLPSIASDACARNCHFKHVCSRIQARILDQRWGWSDSLHVILPYHMGVLWSIMLMHLRSGILRKLSKAPVWLSKNSAHQRQSSVWISRKYSNLLRAANLHTTVIDPHFTTH